MIELRTHELHPTTANSYLKLDEIADLIQFVPTDFTEFLAEDIEVQKMNILLATRRIDNRYRFKGYRTKQIYPLSFPRVDNSVNANNPDEVHSDIKMATLILANTLYLSELATQPPVGTTEDPRIKREKIGRTLEREYFDDNLNEVEKVDLDKYDLLMEYLKPWLGEQHYLCRA